MWLLLISLCYLFTFNYAQDDCLEGCKEPTLLYDGLNCKPIYNSSKDCCPIRYDCSHIEKADEKKCQFRGKTYNIGESLNDDEIYENCRVDCTCDEGYDGRPGFECAALDCPEWLGHQANKGCLLTYELDKCCSVGETCPPFNATCKVSDKTYYEGEKFYPPEIKCTKCTCQKGFKGKFEEPFCKKESCVEEIGNQNKVKDFCAPSYITMNDCCPINWICPKDNDVIATEENRKVSSDLKCKFGKKELNVGEKFNRTSEYGGKLSCECRIPPYLTCIQNYEYSA